jgi:hypothetical protein
LKIISIVVSQVRFKNMASIYVNLGGYYRKERSLRSTSETMTMWLGLLRNWNLLIFICAAAALFCSSELLLICLQLWELADLQLQL